MSEVKYIVPDMAKTFGKLEFGGEMDVSRRRVNGRSAVLSREGKVSVNFLDSRHINRYTRMVYLIISQKASAQPGR